MVADIAPAHRQGQPVAADAAPLVPAQQKMQEGGQLLQRGLAAEQQHLVLGRGQLVGGDLQHPALERRVFPEKLVQPLARHAAGGHRGDRLAAIGVAPVIGETDDIGGEQKAGDHPPPVRQELINPGAALADDEDVLRRVAFVKQRLPGRRADIVHDLGEAGKLVAGQRVADAEIAHLARRAGRRRLGAADRLQIEYVAWCHPLASKPDAPLRLRH